MSEHKDFYETHGLDETAHPPEALTSRELAEDVLRHIAFDLGETYVPSGAGEELIDEITALIDAWVRVRELKAQIEEHEILCENGSSCYRRKELEDDLATAHKQLEEKL